MCGCGVGDNWLLSTVNFVMACTFTKAAKLDALGDFWLVSFFFVGFLLPAFGCLVIRAVVPQAGAISALSHFRLFLVTFVPGLGLPFSRIVLGKG